MSRPLPSKLSEAQLEIMTIVWDRGECTVKEVLQELRQRRQVTRNTVHTMMTRLADKGWLTHRDRGQGFVYRAAVPRAAVRRHQVDQILQTVFDGSAEGLLLAILENQKLSRDEASRIRRMIRQAEERS